jgi:hypothetical protein
MDQALVGSKPGDLTVDHPEIVGGTCVDGDILGLLLKDLHGDSDGLAFNKLCQAGIVPRTI